ncbi:hypothetical protein G4B88_025731 [Cannabis sativa]|uniref:Protein DETOXIFICATION n=1 Tax=Cannabis sativa TaxID=3483 RepID=A0A7J6F4A6_CANSA|nr:hypothetical protein G4B88_025731 [Cannabis sativa]
MAENNGDNNNSHTIPKKITTSTKWNFNLPIGVFFKDARHVFKWDSLGKEILGMALPAALAVAADPIASLIDTAFIGHIGPVELAAAGVSIALFNQASRITIFPLVSITTSFVAEEDTVANMKLKAANHVNDDMEKGVPTKLEQHKENDDDDDDDDSETENNNNDNNVVSKLDKITKVKKGKRQIASASTALIFGIILGLVQAIFLMFGARTLLGVMGVKHDSPMLGPAEKYLVTRSFGAPAVLLTLAMQGIFRGFKDTTTPLYVILLGYSLNVALDPLLIFVCHLGIRGAAIAHVLSQKVNLLPPSLKDLQFGRFLKNGGFLLARVIAVTFCVTLAASLAARLGATPMAAFQTCLQAILACAFAEKDYQKATAAANRVLQMSFVLGVGLTFLVGIGLYFGAGIFTRDVNVLHLIRIGLPFVAATQPLNSLSFVFDGVNFGASDFAYSAYSLALVAVASITALFTLSKSHGFVGIWIALTIYMGLRMFAGIWRMGTGTGPWRFLRVPFAA